MRGMDFLDGRAKMVAYDNANVQVVRVSMITDLKDVEIPKIPQIAKQILLALSDPNVDVGSIANRVTQDVGLTADLFKSANSAAVGSQRATTDPKEAICRIGLTNFRAIVAGFAFSKGVAFPPSRFFNFADFCKHSAYVGVLAHEIGKVTFKEFASTLHLAGLFHDVGLAVAAQVDKEHIDALTEYCTTHERPFKDAEAGLSILPHRLIGATAIASWGMPEIVCTLVTYHDIAGKFLRPSTLPEMTHKLLDVLLLADELAHGAYAQLESYPLCERTKEMLMKLVGLSPSALQEAVAYADEAMDEYFPS